MTSNGDVQVSLSMCQKAFVQRDYTKGLKVQFETPLPEPLRGKVSEDTWGYTIKTINNKFAEAEEVCAGSVMETLLGCFTCYMNKLLTKTRYEKKLEEIGDFIRRENEETYQDAGLHILHPMDRGLRVIEISILPQQKMY